MTVSRADPLRVRQRVCCVCACVSCLACITHMAWHIHTARARSRHTLHAYTLGDIERMYINHQIDAPPRIPRHFTQAQATAGDAHVV